jgi:CheY-like chemotaxis protein
MTSVSRAAHAGCAAGMPAYVLVVDDDPLILNLVTEILLDEGYRVATARSAAEALDCIEHEVPSVLVTDLMMPIMDGRALALTCRAAVRTASMPILLMSAAFPAYLDDILSVAVHALLAKPFDVFELLAIIAGLIVGRHFDDRATRNTTFTT